MLSRPHSFPGGKVAWLFVPFAKYMVVDKVYGDVTISFGWAQSTLCLIENAILLYAIIRHWKEVANNQSTEGILGQSDFFAFLTCSIQWGKSVFYWIHDAYGGFSHIRHNTPQDLILFFIIPNMIWLIGPLFVFSHMSGKFARTIAAAKGAKTK